jgi:type VI protein secretion system component VasF
MARVIGWIVIFLWQLFLHLLALLVGTFLWFSLKESKEFQKLMKKWEDRSDASGNPNP